MSLVSDFDYDLPPELIAQHPRPRGTSRLLVVDRTRRQFEERSVRDLPDLFNAGDIVVANDTRVFPARLLGHRDPSGGAVECLLLERTGEDTWMALVHPGQKLKEGARVIFENPSAGPGVRLRGEILARRFFGKREIRLRVEQAAGLGRQASQTAAPPSDVESAIDALGHIPLPPYIHRLDEPEDRERYQTVFAERRGSIAAPTAGLHFDDALIESIKGAGVGWATVTLHVGYGTFKPVRAERVEDHQVDREWYSISADTAAAVRKTRSVGKRVIAVGTTTTRALENAALRTGEVEAGEGYTDLFIAPGFRFHAIDALLTNFHLPRSSLLMLVAAFAGLELTLAAYADAVRRRFHFYSYGDAMLVV